jgi:hypothetical protein
MFRLSKKNLKKKVLQKKYNKLIKVAFGLSKIDRSLSSQKVFEADKVLRQLEKIS